jgi:hypothetical protein
MSPYYHGQAYGLVKQLTKTLCNNLYLPYMCNVCSFSHLMTDLKTIELDRDMRIISFDVENMYTIITKRDSINIINNMLESNPETTRISENILHILQTVME